MPMLADQRWELYANYLARGMTQAAAHRKAGFKPSRKGCAALAQQPLIKARIAELTGVVIAETGLTVKKVLDELQKIGFANMLDYIEIDTDSHEPKLDFSRVDRDKAAAIGEITTDVITSPRTGEVTRRTKFKLLDKKGALVDLGRHLGAFKETHEHKHLGVVFHVTKDDMAL